MEVAVAKEGVVEAAEVEVRDEAEEEEAADDHDCQQAVYSLLGTRINSPDLAFRALPERQ